MGFKADLHLHSLQSDGSLGRPEILRRALALGVTHLCFTEHDDPCFSAAAAELGPRPGLVLLPGVEISARDPRTGKRAHILGYLYRSTGAITALCDPTLRRRHENCLWQIGVLQRLGYRITPQQVLAYAPSGVLYKQHIYHYLLDSGQSEALFGRVSRTLFKNGGPCDRSIPYPSALEAVAAIRADGGWAVLAHPGQQQNFDLIPLLAGAGLWGVELCHPSHSPADRQKIARLAAAYGLACTGGSDFHGAYETGREALACTVAPPDCPLPAMAEAFLAQG